MELVSRVFIFDGNKLVCKGQAPVRFSAAGGLHAQNLFNEDHVVAVVLPDFPGDFLRQFLPDAQAVAGIGFPDRDRLVDEAVSDDAFLVRIAFRDFSPERFQAFPVFRHVPDNACSESGGCRSPSPS